MSTRARKNYEQLSMQEEKGRYNHITIDQRIALINMVIQDGFSVYRASKLLSINNSTAKVILRNYRKRGHIYRRKTQRNKRLQKVVLEIGAPINNRFKSRKTNLTTKMKYFSLRFKEMFNWILTPIYLCVFVIQFAMFPHFIMVLGFEQNERMISCIIIIIIHYCL